MSFTYNLSTPTDVTRVRFHIGDTDATLAIFSDEEIEFVITEAGSYQRAVIWCIQNIITKISAEPDSTADWLRVDWGRSLRGYQALLAVKRQELGVTSTGNTLVATAWHTYRADSLQSEAPDYADEDEDE
jgi:hypothetical protein